MLSLKDILRLFVYALAVPTAVWAIASITSCTHVIRPPEAAASALVPVLETKIFAQSNERSGFEYVAFDVPEPKETILGAVNGATSDASPRRRIQGAEIALTAMSSSRTHLKRRRSHEHKKSTR